MITDSYYSGVNTDLLAKIPLDAKIIIEIGCGSGAFGSTYLSFNPHARYIGIEVHRDSIQSARPRLSSVIEGDVEDEDVVLKLDLELNGELADVLIFGDVLEHLRDPWKVLSQLRSRVRDQGVCVACIPNVSHWSLLQQQLLGRWDYADSGLLDRTHLRFFTRSSAEALFKASGWDICDSSPRVLWPEKTAKAVAALESAALSLGADSESFKIDVSAFQWVIRVINGVAPKPLTVAGIGLQKFAGVTEARIDYPLFALRSIPGLNVFWSSGGLTLPRDCTPGVFILHRPLLCEDRDFRTVESLISKGWLVVTDMDDDPNHWRQYRDSSHLAFRGVHSVTVSTDALARVMEEWNPEIAVLPNQIFQLHSFSLTVPKSNKLKIFYGALNRQPDWNFIKEGIIRASLELINEVQWVIVHDKEFFDSLPNSTDKRFFETLPSRQYLTLLSECDVSLLPLLDTPFNRLKSDLKLIESFAVGVVPICSAVVYSVNPAHLEIACFAHDAQQWFYSIVGLCRNYTDLERRRHLGLLYVSQSRLHGLEARKREAVYRNWFMRREELEKLRMKRLST